MTRSIPRLLPIALVLFLAINAGATQYKVIYTFQNISDAYIPEAQLIADSSGNLYGVSQFGGTHGLGTVFELSPTGDTWTESILYSFTGGADGEEPIARLALDSQGNLYGTAEAGGDASCTSFHGYCGTLFEISPQAGGTWTETTLVQFTGSNGLQPIAGLTFDAAGNLYGTTRFGGANGGGEVFELSPNGSGGWTQTIVHSFSANAQGYEPNSDLVFDSDGNLFGTTAYGGLLADCLVNVGCGTVFRLSPQSGGTWTETTLDAFNGKDGQLPTQVTFDPSGNLIGVTPYGGVGTCPALIVPGCGELFEIKASGGAKIIHQFQAEPVATPNNVVIDSSGNIYGTSFAGGFNTCGINQPCGTIYEASPQPNGGYAFSLLYKFPGKSANGFWPYAALTIDSKGNIYGTTANGGNLNCGIGGGCGVVFQIIP
jgi:uncharacterized repeat protein (TIGR03803 family)